MSENIVNIYDKNLMISLGIHPRNAEPRDPSVWTKTDKEKADVKRMRLRHKKDRMTGCVVHDTPIPFYSTLIVHIKADVSYATKKNKDGSPDRSSIKTTHSIQCGQSSIPSILTKFINTKGENIVTKYRWNGKTYKPSELPFWSW